MNSAKKNEKYWKKKLSKGQYEILRSCGTEAPFTVKYLDNKRGGVYKCAGCKQPLFSSETKYDSKSGWPSFWDAVDENNIILEDDNSLGISRVEVKCVNCGGHLGHVFDDGPMPTGKRYCINSIALDFISSRKV